MRTVHVTATVKLILKVNEGVDVSEAVSDLLVHTEREETRLDVEDARFENITVTDSR